MQLSGFKELASIVAVITATSGLITGLVAWIHAEAVIPRILRETNFETMVQIDRHSRTTHDLSVTQREFKLWSEQVIKRLEAIEDAVRSQP